MVDNPGRHPPEANPEHRIYVAGHSGLVGSALIRCLHQQGYVNICTATHAQLDLRDGRAVADFFADQQPHWVINAAGLVGGIQANQDRPAEFLYDNLTIQANVIHQAHLNNVQRLITFASSCAYPRNSIQPTPEQALMGGPIEPTNDAYGIAKIAGLKLCTYYRQQYGRDFQCLVPANLYGPGDNFHNDGSHVIPAMLRKLHQAKTDGLKTVEFWGTGQPIREFLFVDDLARMVVDLLHSPLPEQIVNIGTDQETTISSLAQLTSEVVGYRGTISFDSSKKDGHPKKLLATDRMHGLGLKTTVSLRKGLEQTYQWFLKEGQHNAI